MKSPIIYLWIAVGMLCSATYAEDGTFIHSTAIVLAQLCGFVAMVMWHGVEDRIKSLEESIKKLSRTHPNKESYWEYVGQSDGDFPKEVYRCAHCKRLKEVVSKNHIYEIKYCDRCGAHLVCVKVDEGKDY